MPYGVTVTPIITAKQFRADFPEFTDLGVYPDSSVNYWLAVGTILLDPLRWGTILQLGLELFVAHNLVVEAQAQQTALAQGWPGESRGAISSENAGDVSVNYDTQNTLEVDAGHWNLTMFGTRFIRWAKMAGAGPVQVGPCNPCPGTVSDGSGGAWSGPDCWPGWFGS
jgi:Protein of unknown function (DUF4054)